MNNKDIIIDVTCIKYDSVYKHCCVCLSICCTELYKILSKGTLSILQIAFLK